MREVGPGKMPKVASPVGLVETPELVFHKYMSQEGAVAVTVTAPELPEPGALKIKLKLPAEAVE
jgi:hypothetical protein